MMKKIAAVLGFLILVVSAQTFPQGTDQQGAKDHPLLSRIPGYYIGDQVTKDFDSYTSPYLNTDNVWEGKTTTTNYSAKEGAKQFSFIQIVRNYENAIKKLKGKILHSDTRILAAKIENAGAVTYVSVEAFNDGRDYTLLIVETKPMADEVTIDAAALNKGIADAGKIAVYGIYFDVGKSVVKPESKPTIDEIVKLLTQHSTLKLFVVGHTDGDGSAESNMKLSADRAAAIVKVLIGNGVQAARLKAAGVGAYCPIETNRTTEGKAKNRRVELVEMF
jgi:OmpA-OmpF porin, OOP family